MSRHPLTREGAERLREELQHLKKKARPAIIAAIAEARAHGDLRENAEYHAAREQQGFTEARIRHLESVLSGAHIIDVGKVNANGRVVFGATVTLADLDSGEETRYQIVGDPEADLKHHRVAISSPLARALIGKQEGDEVEVQAPGGNRALEIISIEYI
ncbi:MAG: transcription elongation factor GreA [Xanthomonadales bacterium]|uniref:transcription elongation factor GreA n=1 Tax=Hydrogenophaga sp. TaxID=1904254 RepID=UPI0016A868C0|nr:transcription elongation factor GreA [Hydrogenophaga sp.]NIM69371.1 transcription elongation factor GreA [Xanthomonadales bacterium]NIN32191.1 transcription elongation factor GreA [Hydrogenophaga sp.]NIN58793.1 transcription elongation factor GreA [Xanthomonadales bacterium]NIN74061.1 transcription elongation factor GreA [Xanthomonadales bacterium]NIO14590.1 transcription elongation factor GreA [Xanthomonadales bacterium]